MYENEVEATSDNSMIELYKLLKKYGLEFVMTVLCLWLLLAANEERKTYLKELSDTRVQYIESLNKLTNSLELINVRLANIEDKVRKGD